MKILILTFYYEPDLCAGSFRNTAFVQALKKYLQPSDTVDIITTMPNRYSTHREEAQEEEKDGNITIKRIRMPDHQSGMVDQSISFMTFAFKTFIYLNKRSKYDVVFASSSRLMTAYLGALIANRQKAKLFLDMRDIFTDTMGDIFAESKLKYTLSFFRYIEKYTINSAAHINLVSNGFEEYFTHLNDTAEYSFHSNGIDRVFLEYDFEKETETDKKVITYAGNIGEGQGLEKIVPDMAKKLPENFEIHIIGDGGRKKRLVEALKDAPNVKLFPAVNREKLLEIYKNSDYLFLHLNDYDAFKKVLPSKIFEYAATNKFIIAGVSGYAREFMETHVSDMIVFDPCDADDFYRQFNILLTGGRGFVGTYFADHYGNKYDIRRFSFQNDDLNTLDLTQTDTIVHLSALVHQMDGASTEAYFRINVDNTLALAEKAKESGVAHFIFMSSVKVYGEENLTPYTEKTACEPEDDYGKSKLEAERRLLEMQDDTFKVSILRTPVVYGYGVKANIQNLIGLVSRVPVLPLGSIRNRRTMVYIGNLCALLDRLCETGKEGVFLAGDDRPLSTSELIVFISNGLGKRTYLIKIPFFASLIKALKPSFYKRLYENLEVDNTLTKKALDFKNPFSVEEGMSHMIHGETL